MDKTVLLRIIIEKPVSGVEYGVQKAKGASYETVQKQAATLNNLTFEIPVSLKVDANKEATFVGPFAQGPPHQRFIYIAIGTNAGQKDTPWSRRLKIPLTGISKTILTNDSALQVLVTTVPGTGKDGGPNCATVNPFTGWKLSQ